VIRCGRDVPQVGAYDEKRHAAIGHRPVVSSWRYDGNSELKALRSCPELTKILSFPVVYARRRYKDMLVHVPCSSEVALMSPVLRLGVCWFPSGRSSWFPSATCFSFSLISNSYMCFGSMVRGCGVCDRVALYEKKNPKSLCPCHDPGSLDE
jgi:hypothetical protein